MGGFRGDRYWNSMGCMGPNEALARENERDERHMGEPKSSKPKPVYTHFKVVFSRKTTHSELVYATDEDDARKSFTRHVHSQLQSRGVDIEVVSVSKA